MFNQCIDIKSRFKHFSDRVFLLTQSDRDSSLKRMMINVLGMLDTVAGHHETPLDTNLK